MIALRPLAGGKPSRFEGHPVAIGRADTNQIVLKSPLVSSSHALILPTASGYSVRDRGSTNGTFVVRGGERIAVPADGEIALQAGDILLVGGVEGVELAIELEARSAAADPTVLAAERPG